MPKKYDLICQNKTCSVKFSTVDKRQKFCSKKCAAIVNNSNRPDNFWTAERKEKSRQSVLKKFKEDPTYSQRISNSLKLHYVINGNPKKGKPHSIAVGNATKSRYNPCPKNIYDMSNRSRMKVIRRLELPCVRCQWNEEVCDVHHIKGRKIEDPHNHSNLTILCPNCHRLVENGKVDCSKFLTFEQIVGDRWKTVYYG